MQSQGEFTGEGWRIGCATPESLAFLERPARFREVDGRHRLVSRPTSRSRQLDGAQKPNQGENTSHAPGWAPERRLNYGQEPAHGRYLQITSRTVKEQNLRPVEFSVWDKPEPDPCGHDSFVPQTGPARQKVTTPVKQNR